MMLENKAIMIYWTVCILIPFYWLTHKRIQRNIDLNAQHFIEESVKYLKKKTKPNQKNAVVKRILVNESFIEEKIIAELKEMNVECIGINNKRIVELEWEEADAVLLEISQKDCLLAKEIRRERQDLPIYGCTFSETWESLMTVLEYEMNGTIKVPLSAQLLSELLHKDSI